MGPILQKGENEFLKQRGALRMMPIFNIRDQSLKSMHYQQNLSILKYRSGTWREDPTPEKQPTPEVVST